MIKSSQFLSRYTRIEPDHWLQQLICLFLSVAAVFIITNFFPGRTPNGFSLEDLQWKPRNFEDEGFTSKNSKDLQRQRKIFKENPETQLNLYLATFSFL